MWNWPGMPNGISWWTKSLSGNYLTNFLSFCRHSNQVRPIYREGGCCARLAHANTTWVWKTQSRCSARLSPAGEDPRRALLLGTSDHPPPCAGRRPISESKRFARQRPTLRPREIGGAAICHLRMGPARKKWLIEKLDAGSSQGRTGLAHCW